MKKLFGKTLLELQTICADMAMPRFAAAQIASWLYKRHASEIEQMSDLSKENRAKLSANYCVGLEPPLKVAESADGTKKYLFKTDEGSYIESAYIPDGDRSTLCVSSQAGCRMGCKFCMTAKVGFKGNLSAGEIINQVASIPESEQLDNVVYMGMGEPMDNVENVIASIEVLTSQWGYAWSPTRITVSTIGVLDGLKQMLERTKVHIAVSLHNPFENQRLELMPAQNSYPITEVVELLKKYDFSGQRRVSFEYIVLKGINDSPLHVKELARLLNGLKCRINLIAFHKVEGSDYFSPDRKAMERFRDALTAKGIVTTIRTSRGEDIDAACGQLSAKHAGN